jgi:hypothetical protein
MTHSWAETDADPTVTAKLSTASIFPKREGMLTSPLCEPVNRPRKCPATKRRAQADLQAFSRVIRPKKTPSKGEGRGRGQSWRRYPRQLRRRVRASLDLRHLIDRWKRQNNRDSRSKTNSAIGQTVIALATDAIADLRHPEARRSQRPAIAEAVFRTRPGGGSSRYAPCSSFLFSSTHGFLTKSLSADLSKRLSKLRASKGR